MMPTANEIIGIFCLIDDLLKTIGYYEDVQRQVSDNEITTALASKMLDERRFNQVATCLVGINPRFIYTSRLLTFNTQLELNTLSKHLLSQTNVIY